MSEILPCPCCGTAPKISVDPDSDTTTISCPHCGLRNWSYKSRRVIGEWNKRLDVESLTRENERLREAVSNALDDVLSDEAMPAHKVALLRAALSGGEHE